MMHPAYDPRTAGRGAAIAAISASTSADGPAICRQRLGAQLRRHRTAAGMRLADAAAVLDVTSSTLCRIETGQAFTRTSYLRLLLDLYHVTDPGQRATLATLAGLARDGQRHGWQGEYAELLPPGAARCLGLQDAAARICVHATQVVPSLLQTPGYAATAAARPGQADMVAALTALRQRNLTRPGLRLHAIIDEAALIRPPGPGHVMAGQLDHLAALADAGNLTLQVLQLATPLPARSPAFTLLTFPGTADPDTACTAGHAGQHHLSHNARHVQELARAFTALGHAALPAGASAQLISELARRHRSQA